VRGRVLSERNLAYLARARVEPAQVASRLSGEPHPAVHGGCDVMRMRTSRNGVLLDDRLRRRRHCR
jgi:hypothetical protein